MDIVAFLNARLDEDEADAEAAQAVDPGPWTVEVIKNVRGEDVNTNWRSGHGAATVVAADTNPLWEPDSSTSTAGEQCMTVPTARYVARHDPARVLREVAAKRCTLARHSHSTYTDRYHGPACEGCGYEDEGSPRNYISECPELRDLAAPYADHPDYRPAWSVE